MADPATQETKMVDSPLDPETDTGSDDKADPARGPGPPPATPRWVRVLGIVVLAAVLLVVVLMLAGGHAPPVQHGS